MILSIHLAVKLQIIKQLLQFGCLVICTLVPFPAYSKGETPKIMEALSSLVKKDNLDVNAYAEWVDGHELVIKGADKESSPEWVLWTDSTVPGHSGLMFGKSANYGVRHLRIGFKVPIQLGTVLVKGGGQLSALNTSYPGNLANNAEWIPAQRLVDGKVSTAETAPNQIVAWVFPPGTYSRALRFTHKSIASDPKYEGQLSGMIVFSERFENLSPLAYVSAGSNTQNAKKIANEIADGWHGWENIEKSSKIADIPIISAAHPEWTILVWPKPVNIGGLTAFFAGFNSADVQAYIGKEAINPRDASDSDWEMIGKYENLHNGYPVQLWPNSLEFHKEVTTRAVRIQMTSVTDELHPHLKGNTMAGRRIWLDELMVFSPLGNKPLKDHAYAIPNSESLKPPIPVKFSLKEPSFLTLVLEKTDGQRVRNLISETYFPAGENTVWWDGSDDLGRDTDAASHGLYQIPFRLVKPGEFRVRGLTRSAINTLYEFSVYSTGTPSWNTPDKTGGWLANHSPPQAVVFVPASKNQFGKSVVYLGAYVSEGHDGVAWVDLDGRKLGGKTWVGGNWTGAPFMALDLGQHAIGEHLVYVGSVWESGMNDGQAELRITALTTGIDKSILKFKFDPADPKKMNNEIAGLAAFDGVIVVSLPQRKELLFIDAVTGQNLGELVLEEPRGLAFDKRGRLYVVVGKQVRRYVRAQDPTQMPVPEVLISSGLDDPQQITLDSAENLYVSDWGESHQVKVFSPDSKLSSSNNLSMEIEVRNSKIAEQELKTGEYNLVRAIGHPGVPKAGPYDPLHMNHPYGLTVDSNNHLWVAEMDLLPKRVSIWTTQGELYHAFYGRAKYGGGGTLDSVDKNLFFYSEENHGAMAFKLDWEKGTSELTSIYYRPEPADLKLAFRSAAPETALYYKGKRYFTNSYNSNPVAGHNTAFLFLERNGVARPVAAFGRANEWDILKTRELLAVWPNDMDPHAPDSTKSEAYFSWTDDNGDGQVQSNEVLIQKGSAGGITVMPDLSFCFARQSGRSVRYAPVRLSQDGIPQYDLKHPQVLADGVKEPVSSGGNQVLFSSNGWMIATLGISPFAPQSLSGAKDGKAMWSYPSLWPGLHASHEAPTPDRPGQLIGTTRLLGSFFNVDGSDAGPFWAINGNLGTVYVFTSDGLFVATLFEDARIAKPWAMPEATRGMKLDGVTLNGENFWPTISRISDGNIYLVDGERSSIVNLRGLETVRRLADKKLIITKSDLAKAREYNTQKEILRQREQGQGVLQVAMLPEAPIVDGKLNDWKSSWVDIEKRGVKAFFNSASKPYDISASLAVAGGRLYAAYRTGTPKMLANSGEEPTAMFKTGGALDLMIGANPFAEATRKVAVSGDMRLIVTLVKGLPKAILYRAVVPGTADSVKIPFSSPWRTILFDQVIDISSQLQFAEKGGDYEFSVPLSVLGVNPQLGLRIKGDIGVLLGEAFHTSARIYWANKATSITSDVPSEAELSPMLWGTFEFQPLK